MYLVLHHCASSVNTVRRLFSTTSRTHLQHGCLTKLFKHQASCTLLFTNVLQVLTLCKVGLLQRVGHIYNMAAWPSFSSIKLRVPCSSPMCFKCLHCARSVQYNEWETTLTWLLDQAFQASSLVCLVLHQCASGVNTVQSRSSRTSGKHLQHGCLTKRFKRQAWCTLIFTNVL